MAKEASQRQPQSWDGIVRRQIDFECRSINEEERSLEVVASTDTLDAHGDIVDQSFDLKRYKKNPVVLWHHNSFGFLDGSTAEDFLPIGRAEGVKIEDGKLVAKIYFVAGTAEEEPLVDKIWRRVKQKVLRAVSIGFRPGVITEEKRDGGTVFRFSDNELYEISVVPIPANPDAVAKHIAWERENLGRTAAEKTAERGKEVIEMTEEEKRALEAANTAKGVAEKLLADESAKTKKLESDLAAEKVLTKKLETDLESSKASLAVANTAQAKAALDLLQGKKFAPVEREELEAMVKDLGLERVTKYLEKRADLAITEPVPGIDKSAAPPSVTSADASSDIAAAAIKGL